MIRILKATVVAVAVCLVAGTGIQTSIPMPSYAVLMLDDMDRTYLAPSCIDEWQRRPSVSFAILRRSTVNEARQNNYKPDPICRETGAFVEDGPSLTGIVLMKIGIPWPTQRYWWDAPYRTEDGAVAHPNHTP